MKTRPIQDGRVIVVDDFDYYLIDRDDGVYIVPGGYVVLYLNRGMVRLHRHLTGASKGQVVDHINGNPLDNRRANLRICTSAENRRNSKLYSHSKSGLKGVYFDKQKNRWRARITVNYRRMFLGNFGTKEEAHAAYWQAAQEHHKEFARAA